MFVVHQVFCFHPFWWFSFSSWFVQAGSEVRLTLKHYKAATPFLLRQFGKWVFDYQDGVCWSWWWFLTILISGSSLSLTPRTLEEAPDWLDPASQTRLMMISEMIIMIINNIITIIILGLTCLRYTRTMINYILQPPSSSSLQSAAPHFERALESPTHLVRSRLMGLAAGLASPGWSSSSSSWFLWWLSSCTYVHIFATLCPLEFHLIVPRKQVKKNWIDVVTVPLLMAYTTRWRWSKQNDDVNLNGDITIDRSLELIIIFMIMIMI